MHLTRLRFLLVIGLCTAYNAQSQAASDGEGGINWDVDFSPSELLSLVELGVYEEAQLQAAGRDMVNIEFQDGLQSDSKVLRVLNPFVILAPEIIEDGEKKREIVTKLRNGQQFFELQYQNRCAKNASCAGWDVTDGYASWEEKLHDLALRLVTEQIKQNKVPENFDGKSLSFKIGGCTIIASRERGLSTAVQAFEVTRRQGLEDPEYTFPTVQECCEDTANGVISDAISECKRELKEEYLPVLSPFYFGGQGLREKLAKNPRVGAMGLLAAQLAQSRNGNSQVLSAVKYLSAGQMLMSAAYHTYKTCQYLTPRVVILAKYALPEKYRGPFYRQTESRVRR